MAKKSLGGTLDFAKEDEMSRSRTSNLVRAMLGGYLNVRAYGWHRVYIVRDVTSSAWVTIAGRKPPRRRVGSHHGWIDGVRKTARAKGRARRVDSARAISPTFVMDRRRRFSKSPVRARDPTMTTCSTVEVGCPPRCFVHITLPRTRCILCHGRSREVCVIKTLKTRIGFAGGFAGGEGGVIDIRPYRKRARGKLDPTSKGSIRHEMTRGKN
ncbi:hypothetical protein V8E55_008867 [Tylopilus felleus]